MSADTPEQERLEKVEAARLERERLGPLVAAKVKQFEGMTLEQVMARWAELMKSQAGWESYDDDFKA